jgi:hypothetical protein
LAVFLDKLDLLACPVFPVLTVAMELTVFPACLVLLEILVLAGKNF